MDSETGITELPAKFPRGQYRRVFDWRSGKEVCRGERLCRPRRGRQVIAQSGAGRHGRPSKGWVDGRQTERSRRVGAIRAALGPRPNQPVRSIAVLYSSQGMLNIEQGMMNEEVRKQGKRIPEAGEGGNERRGVFMRSRRRGAMAGVHRQRSSV